MCNSKLQQNRILKNNAVRRLHEASDVLDAISTSYLITNNRAEIIYCNEAFRRSCNIDINLDVENLRPGDIFQCVNAGTKKSGCGTHSKCRYCNFRNCIVEALEEQIPIQKESIINNVNNKMTALLVTATPFFFENQSFVSITTIDITDRKKKDLMESVFFHDLINLAGSLDAYLGVISTYETQEIRNHINTVKQISSQVLDEIISHREISKAEENSLDTEISEIDINELIEEITDIFNFHPSKSGKEINFHIKNDFIFESDRKLLERTLINMIKNALEAICEGETVHVIITKLLSDIVFEVRNPGEISPDVFPYIFTYGYSTKGKGRGIGTYSIKLLGENFLKGKAWYESNEKEGTAFYLKIPILYPMNE